MTQQTPVTVDYQGPVDPPAPGRPLVYVEGARLVVPQGFILRGNCIKCNASDTSPLAQTLRWHNPWLFLTLLIGIAPYALVVLNARRKAEVTVPLCAHHHARRKRHLMAAGGILVLSLVLLMLGIVLADGGLLAFLSLILLMIAIVYADISSRAVWAARIAHGRVWIRGCGPAYLAAVRQEQSMQFPSPGENETPGELAE